MNVSYVINHDVKPAELALFSEKVFSPTDFEVLGIFSDQISKELSGFFETREFLDNLKMQ